NPVITQLRPRPGRRAAVPTATRATTRTAATRGTGAVGAREEGAAPPAPVRMPPAGADRDPAASLKTYSSPGSPAPPSSATEGNGPGLAATGPFPTPASAPARPPSTR